MTRRPSPKAGKNILKISSKFKISIWAGKVLFELFYLEFYLHFYLHFEFTVNSDYDRSKINIFNNKNVTKSTNHVLVLVSDSGICNALPVTLLHRDPNTTIFIEILNDQINSELFNSRISTRGLEKTDQADWQHRCWWRMLETKCVGDNF